jgi:hypothetical protein
MEPRFGQDFSGVRVHTDTRSAASAQSLSANAYTLGEHITFAPGRYHPETSEGMRLLTHELTHTVQQRREGATPSPDSNAPHEREADQVAAALATGVAFPSITQRTGFGLALQPESSTAAHAGGAMGEFDVAFALGQRGFEFVIGPAGSGGHELTEKGFDGIAHNPQTGETWILDNKASGGTSTVQEAPAIVTNLEKNLVKAIADVEDLPRFPNQAAVVKNLQDALSALSQGQPLPAKVRVKVTNAGGYHSGISKKLKAANVEFEDITGSVVRDARKRNIARAKAEGRRSGRPSTKPAMDAHEGSKMPKSKSPMDEHEGFTMPKPKSSPMDEHEGFTMPKPKSSPMNEYEGFTMPKPRPVASPSGEVGVAGPGGVMSGSGVLRAGGNIGADILTGLIFDYVNAEIKEHFDRKIFEQRLRALQPEIEARQTQALQHSSAELRSLIDKRQCYWIIQLRITVHTTVVIAGAGSRNIVSPPEPELLSVAISESEVDGRGPVESKKPDVAPAAHAVILLEESQVVTYSQPIVSWHSAEMEALGKITASFPGKWRPREPKTDKTTLRFSGTSEEVTVELLMAWAKRNHPRGLADPTLVKSILGSHEFSGSDDAREWAAIALVLKLREEK